MARISYRTVSTQTSETVPQLVGRMNRQRALRRLINRKPTPTKTLSEPDLRKSIDLATMKPVEKLPVVKLKEGGFFAPRSSTQMKYHSMAEYNNMRRNYKNYSHYSYLRPESSSESFPALREQGTNTDSLSLLPFTSFIARPKTAAVVGIPPVNQTTKTSRTARSAGGVVRRAKVAVPQAAIQEESDTQGVINNTYRLQGSGFRKQEEVPVPTEQDDPDQQELDIDGYCDLPETRQAQSALNNLVEISAMNKPKLSRPGIHFNHRHTKLKAYDLKLYPGSDIAHGRTNTQISINNNHKLFPTKEQSSVSRRVTFREDQNQNIFLNCSASQRARGYIMEAVEEEARGGHPRGSFALTEKNLEVFHRLHVEKADESEDEDSQTNRRVSDWVQQRVVQIPDAQGHRGHAGSESYRSENE